MLQCLNYAYKIKIWGACKYLNYITVFSTFQTATAVFTIGQESLNIMETIWNNILCYSSMLLLYENVLKEVYDKINKQCIKFINMGAIFIIVLIGNPKNLKGVSIKWYFYFGLAISLWVNLEISQFTKFY